MRLTDKAQAIVAQTLRPGGIAVDATAGNGHDTVFLARSVGQTGRVFAFDVQPAAIDATRRRLAEQAPELAGCVELTCASHEHMDHHLPEGAVGRIDAIMFNLGYLPGGDKTRTTLAQSTCPALGLSLDLLSEDGVMTVLAYPGHPQGQLELDALPAFFERTAHRAIWCAQGAAPGNGPRLFTGRRLT